MRGLKYLVRWNDGTSDTKLPESLREIFGSRVKALRATYALDPRDRDRLDIVPVSGALEAAKEIEANEARAVGMHPAQLMVAKSQKPEVGYIPEDDAARKAAPMFRGLLGYFPAALFEVAAHSLESDRKHNPGNPEAPTWARGKSSDHEDCIVRHLVDAGPRRRSGCPAWELFKEWAAPKFSSAKDARRYALRCLAWRALAMLQEDCEADGAMPGVSSRGQP